MALAALQEVLKDRRNKKFPGIEYGKGGYARNREAGNLSLAGGRLISEVRFASGEAEVRR